MNLPRARAILVIVHKRKLVAKSYRFKILIMFYLLSLFSQIFFNIIVAKEFTIPGKDVSTISKAVSGDVKSKVYEEMVPIYQTLCRDEQDSVRLLAVSASGSMGCALGLDGNICSRIVLPVIQAGVTDLSW